MNVLRIRRAFLWTCGVAALALSVAVLAGDPGGALGSGTISPAAQLRANREAARRDVRELLATVRLPGGIHRIATLPGFARVFAGSDPRGGRYNASDERFWTTTDSGQSIIDYVRAHRPAGSISLGTGSGGDTRTGTTSLEVMFDWPSTSDLYNRSLDVTVVAPARGNAVVVAQSQAFWIVPRPSSELLPPGVTAVRAILRIGGGPLETRHMHTLIHTFTDARRVRAVVNRFDSLPIVQPGDVLACPLMRPGPTLKLQFMAGINGPTLASAEVTVHRGRMWQDGDGSCDPIGFTIGNKQQTSLTGPHFVRWIGNLIGWSIS